VTAARELPVGLEPAAFRPLLLAAATKTLSLLETVGQRRGLNGVVGDALYARELARHEQVDPDPWIERAIRAMNRRPSGKGLHGGLAGLGFTLVGDRRTSVHLEMIDAALMVGLSELPPMSVQNGVAGIGLYSSLRSNSPSGRLLQRAVLEVLAATAFPSREGIVWATPAEYARRRGVEVRAEPVVEYGAVHGIAGGLVALAALAREGHDLAAELARAALNAVWNWQVPGENGFGWITFGLDRAAPARDLKPGRWCVGDAGVLRAIWLAANEVGDTASATRARDQLGGLASRAADGDLPGEEGRLDLCCGVAALAQVYWRMSRETGLSVFGEAADALFAHLLRKLPLLDSTGLAYGRAGVCLTLLSPFASADPGWDGILGMRLPCDSIG
jgi:hypothetical protein